MEKFERDAGRHTVLSNEELKRAVETLRDYCAQFGSCNEGCKFAYYGEDPCLLADKAPAFWGTPEGGRR